MADAIPAVSAANARRRKSDIESKGLCHSGCHARKEGHADLSDRLAGYGTGLPQDHYTEKATFYGGLECEKSSQRPQLSWPASLPVTCGVHSTGVCRGC
jgi:hypothetical protein